jgi:hypothetical protein
MWRRCCALDAWGALENYLVYITKSLLEQLGYIESDGCDTFKGCYEWNPEPDSFHQATNPTSGNKNLLPENTMSSRKVCTM